MLTQQVEQGRFDRGDRMDRGAQVEGLQAAPAAITISKGLLDALQQTGMSTHGLAHHQVPCVLQCLADLLATGHFANAGAASAVGQDQQVAGEKRPMRTA